MPKYAAHSICLLALFCILKTLKDSGLCKIFCERDCVKSVSIRSFSGSYFLAFGLNTDMYSVNLCIQ